MSGPDSRGLTPEGGALALAARHLDILLVLAAAPFVIVAGLPLLGYAVGAGVWVLQRVGGELVERRIEGAEPRIAVGVAVASIMARAWIVALSILAVGLAGDRDDGLMAAVLVLAAFTVYFAMSLIMRTGTR